MSCCGNCFNDKNLKRYIKIRGSNAKCDYCKSDNINCINEINLEEFFKDVFDLYTKCSDIFEKFYRKKEYIPEPETLVSLIQKDWNIFNEDKIDTEEIARLIYNISLNNINIPIPTSEALASKWYRNSDRYFGYFTNRDWEIFCENIKYKYRFNHNFIDENNFEPNDTFNNTIFDYAHRKILKGSILYRARDGYLLDKLKNVINPLPAKKMGIPDNAIITNGRANPPGINYLYTSDEVSTVLAEIRAWKGSINSIAEIFIQKDLNIFDLTIRFELSSPFDTILPLRKEIEVISILQAFANDLSKPANPNFSVIDYIPTQYICELIKIKGFDGIKFKSSLSKGNNIVLFKSEN
ncbi:RES family NAD+ phosphorylase, partial [Desulfosporosinus metallidurans]|uniref:RES family NAD+ phosphorylase n=1 Tax=Desulfosporosinus metallidurans TaxID=1888891 RepID=UPI00094DD0E9